MVRNLRSPRSRASWPPVRLYARFPAHGRSSPGARPPRRPRRASRRRAARGRRRRRDAGDRDRRAAAPRSGPGSRRWARRPAAAPTRTTGSRTCSASTCTASTASCPSSSIPRSATRSARPEPDAGRAGRARARALVALGGRQLGLDVRPRGARRPHAADQPQPLPPADARGARLGMLPMEPARS